MGKGRGVMKGGRMVTQTMGEADSPPIIDPRGRFGGVWGGGGAGIDLPGVRVGGPALSSLLQQPAFVRRRHELWSLSLSPQSAY